MLLKEEYPSSYRQNMKSSYYHYDAPQFDLKSHRIPFQEEEDDNYNQFEEIK
jgi:hypothetical protein